MCSKSPRLKLIPIDVCICEHIKWQIDSRLPSNSQLDFMWFILHVVTLLFCSFNAYIHLLSIYWRRLFRLNEASLSRWAELFSHLIATLSVRHQVKSNTKRQCMCEGSIRLGTLSTTRTQHQMKIHTDIFCSHCNLSFCVFCVMWIHCIARWVGVYISTRFQIAAQRKIENSNEIEFKTFSMQWMWINEYNLGRHKPKVATTHADGNQCSRRGSKNTHFLFKYTDAYESATCRTIKGDGR